MRFHSPKNFLAAKLRNQLIAQVVQRGTLSSDSTIAAMHKVPRHIFVPDVPIQTAYEDRVVVTREQQGEVTSTLSQPSAVGRMLEDLQVSPGMRVLEIGTGTGYNAALLAELTGDPTLVTTVEIDRHMVDRAEQSLDVAGYHGIEVLCADGLTFTGSILFDRIEVSVEAPFIAPGWVKSLRDQGLLLLPLSLKGQRYFTPALRKYSNYLRAESDSGCSFLAMFRDCDSGDTTFRVPGLEQLRFIWESPGEFPEQAIVRALNSRRMSHPDLIVPVYAKAHIVLGHDATFTISSTLDSTLEMIGLYDRNSNSVCLLTGTATKERMSVQSLNGTDAYTQVLSLLAAWRKLDSSRKGDRQILAFPADDTPSPDSDWQVISKPYYNLLVGPSLSKAKVD